MQDKPFFEAAFDRIYHWMIFNSFFFFVFYFHTHISLIWSCCFFYGWKKNCFSWKIGHNVGNNFEFINHIVAHTHKVIYINLPRLTKHLKIMWQNNNKIMAENNENWWKWFFNEIAQWCNWISCGFGAVGGSIPFFFLHPICVHFGVCSWAMTKNWRNTSQAYISKWSKTQTNTQHCHRQTN